MTSPLNNLVQATIKVVTTHREMKRAHRDGANEAARKRYRATMISALDKLDSALEAFAKTEPKPGAPARAPSPPIDWGGMVKAGLAVFRLTQKIKGKTPPEVADIIDAEIVP